MRPPLGRKSSELQELKLRVNSSSVPACTVGQFVLSIHGWVLEPGGSTLPSLLAGSVAVWEPQKEGTQILNEHGQESCLVPGITHPTLFF